MKSVAEAQALILEAFGPLPSERLPLLAALGRFTSQALYAQTDAPEHDNSAMDGYAVRAEDVASASPEAPATLPVRGMSRAGVPSSAPLLPGTAMRIFTGAVVPEGADSVILQEDTQREGELAHFTEAPRTTQHVRAKGSDLRVGELLLPARTKLGSGEIGLLASQGIASIEVARKPRVAVICTGDELRELGEPARPGSVINSNAYALAAQVLEAGGEPWVLPIVRDDLRETQAAIEHALSADVVLLSGGVSVGDYDFVRDALSALGIELSVWKVRLKPGKPVSFGIHGKVPVLGLPGNPVSSWVAFELFVRAGLRTMLGDPAPARRTVEVTLAAPYRRSPRRPEYSRARLSVDSTGRYLATLHRAQGSGSLPSIAGVDALVLVPEGEGPLGQEERLSAIVLREPAADKSESLEILN